MELFLFMTFSASMLILAALLLRPLTGRVLPRALQMALWIAASLRLLLPVNIRTPFSILALFSTLRPATEPLADTAPQTPALPAVPEPVPSSAPAPVLPAVSDPTPVLSPAEPAASLSFSALLPWIWLFGTVLMAGILLILHLREMRRCGAKVRDTQAEQYTPRFVRVFRCRAAAAPFTAGLFRPRIILPETLPVSDLPAVLAHECAHIRGLDILKKHLFAAALCVNWFNPLVWVMVRLAARDLEILCDARALRRPDAPDVKTYAHALLNAEERRTLFTLGFSNHTEVRIMKILKKEKHNRLLMLVSVLLVALLVTACTTAAETDPDLPEPEVSSSEPEISSSEAEATPTPPPAEEADVQTMSNKHPAETVQDLFNKDGVHGFGGLRIGMSWEEAKPIIAEMTGIENPTLPEIRDYRTYIAFPYPILSYEGTVTVTFTTNSFQLTAIECTLSLEGDDAVEAAYSSIYDQLYAQFASPTESYDTAKNHVWHLPHCQLALAVCPTPSFSTMGLGINTDYTGPESVQIGIHPNFTEENAEVVSEGEEYVRFPVRSEGDAGTALFFIENEITQLNMEKERITQLIEAPEQENVE